MTTKHSCTSCNTVGTSPEASSVSPAWIFILSRQQEKQMKIIGRMLLIYFSLDYQNRGNIVRESFPFFFSFFFSLSSLKIEEAYYYYFFKKHKYYHC